MNIKVMDPQTVMELRRQKNMLNPEWSDEEFLKYILEARAQVLARMSMGRIKKDLLGEEAA